jgi:signal transduction histidine kinase
MRRAEFRLETPRYITAQAALRGVPSANSEFRNLAASLLAAQEEERRRVSCELHDELGQRLALLEIQIQEMERRLGSQSAVSPELVRLRTQVGRLADDVHRICCRLHPAILENLGLVVAIRSYCEEHSAWSGIDVRFTHTDVPSRLPAPIALCLYRVAQEALRNVARHAAAKRATVVLSVTRNGLQLTIKDNGQGFDLNAARAKGGLGLISLSERVRLAGGTWIIRSAPGRGTRVQAWVPLAAGASA